MGDFSNPQPLDLPLTPLQVLEAWPVDRPVLLLHSSGGHPRWAEWSVLARPSQWQRLERADVIAAPNRGPSVGADALFDRLSTSLVSRFRPNLNAIDLPFRGGWIGYFAYELGRVLESRACDPARIVGAERSPLVALARGDDALVFHHPTERWFSLGETRWREFLDPFAARNRKFPEISELEPGVPEHAYLSAVERVLDYIGAGDVFQVNLAHRLTAAIRGSTRALARRALQSSRAWYGAYLELPDGRTIVSMSPELFLRIDAATRSITTRPIKGTRPVSCAPAELLASEKDAAELHMIVDLMRNDLGRVCEFGSIQVVNPRAIETHGTVHHGVGEVRGRLREDVSLREIIQATFPPGSVTGAPKIRAMQIIDELEPFDRGPYCGAIGFISDHGDARFNVAIRTIVLEGTRPAGRFDLLDGTLTYGIGGGIVADSDPHREYQETIDKAAVLRQVMRQTSCEAVGVT